MGMEKTGSFFPPIRRREIFFSLSSFFFGIFLFFPHSSFPFTFYHFAKMTTRTPTVVVILDCSSSMVNVWRQSVEKFDQVIRTLREEQFVAYSTNPAGQNVVPVPFYFSESYLVNQLRGLNLTARDGTNYATAVNTARENPLISIQKFIIITDHHGAGAFLTALTLTHAETVEFLLMRWNPLLLSSSISMSCLNERNKRVKCKFVLSFFFFLTFFFFTSFFPPFYYIILFYYFLFKEKIQNKVVLVVH